MSEREIERISQYLKIDPDCLLRDYCQWSAGRPLVKTSGSGYCIFWDKLCTIHKVKPRMCKIWPFIESMLVDPTNWAVVQSVCPGIRRNAKSEDLTEYVMEVLAEYEREVET